MKKTFLAIAVLYGIAACGAPYVVGDQVAKNTHRFFNDSARQQRLAAQGVQLTLKQYHKGYFSSTADLHLTVRDTTTAAILYDGDFSAHIKHAPLSLSGLNVANVKVSGSSQPHGIIGEHVTQEFITATTGYGLMDLMRGNRSIHIELALAPLKTQLNNDIDIDFKGLRADITTPATTAGFGKVSVAFSGLNSKSLQAQSEMTLQPFHADYAVTNETTIHTLTFDTLAMTSNVANTQRGIKLDNASFSANTLTPSNFDLTAVHVHFDNLLLMQQEAQQSGSIKMKDGDFKMGFVPDGNHYALNLVAKAKPVASGLLAEKNPVMPDDIDINLHIAPFSRAFMTEKFKELSTAIYAQPQHAQQIVMTKLPFMLLANATQQEVTANIHALITTSSHKLLAINGTINEHLSSEADLLNIMYNPRSGIAKYFYGSELDIFVSKDIMQSYLDYVTRVSALSGQAAPPSLMTMFLNANGDLKLDLKVADNQIFFNGHPAPF